jgi:hypothetical protein
MALTKETIRGNAELAGLNDKQVAALVQMSQNDENDVIGRRIGEVYRTMDETITNVTGVKRDGDEKTYNFLKRAATELKQKDGASKYTEEIATLKAEKTRLEGLVAKGGNEETQAQLARAKADLENVRKEYASLKKQSEKQKAEYETQIFGVRVDNEINNSLAGIKFKPELPESVTKVLMQQAVEKVKGFNPQFIDDGKGGKVLGFHNSDNSVMRNAATNLQPFTARELVERELEALGVLAGKAAPGAGTQPVQPTGGNGGGVVVDVSSARTRKEFNEIATQSLLQQGKTIGSAEFDTAMQEIVKANEGYKSLPLQ